MDRAISAVRPGDGDGAAAAARSASSASPGPGEPAPPVPEPVGRRLAAAAGSDEARRGGCTAAAPARTPPPAARSFGTAAAETERPPRACIRIARRPCSPILSAAADQPLDSSLDDMAERRRVGVGNQDDETMAMATGVCCLSSFVSAGVRGVVRARLQL